MTLDWDKLDAQKQKLDEKLSRGSKGVSSKFWRPKAGSNLIRVLPSWASDGDFEGQFWREVSQHWDVSEDQRGPVICTRNTPFIKNKQDEPFEEDCPICLFVDELRKRKGDVKAQETVKQVRAKTSYFLNVVDLKDKVYTESDVDAFKAARPDATDIPFAIGDTKVQIFVAPSTVFNDILKTIRENRVDITDMAQGHDVTIKKSGKDLLTKYETTVLMKSSKAPDCKPTPLDKVGFVMDHDEMMTLLGSGVGGDYLELAAPASPHQSASDDDAGDLEAALLESLG